MSYLRNYSRPMGAWWRRNPFYLRYMVREASSVFVAAYAIVLLVGLARLAQGPQAYEAWRASLASPAGTAFHLAALAIIAYHAWTWFKVMPKTLPFVRIGSRRVADTTIVATGVAAAVVASLMLFALVRWLVA